MTSPHAYTVDTGLIVLCDSCHSDYTTSDVMGGVSFNSLCYCPACYHKAIAAATRSHDYDALQFPYFLESFRDFVYRLRDI